RAVGRRPRGARRGGGAGVPSGGWCPNGRRAEVGAAREIALRDDLSIRLVTAPYFIATKYEAFIGRGRGDYLASHDFEDLMAVIGLLQGVELPMSKADRIKLALVAVVFTTGAIVGVNHAAYRRISELENL